MIVSCYRMFMIMVIVGNGMIRNGMDPESMHVGTWMTIRCWWWVTNITMNLFSRLPWMNWVWMCGTTVVIVCHRHREKGSIVATIVRSCCQMQWPKVKWSEKMQWHTILIRHTHWLWSGSLTESHWRIMQWRHFQYWWTCMVASRFHAAKQFDDSCHVHHIIYKSTKTLSGLRLVIIGWLDGSAGSTQNH